MDEQSNYDLGETEKGLRKLSEINGSIPWSLPVFLIVPWNISRVFGEKPQF